MSQVNGKGPTPVGPRELGDKTAADANPLLRDNNPDSTLGMQKQNGKTKNMSNAKKNRNEVPDIVPATAAAQNVAKLPAPNQEGTVGSVPLELIDPKAFRAAPSRDQNKLDTSIDTATYQARKKDHADIIKSLESDNVELLFPWEAVGGFDNTGKGAPHALKDSKMIKAYIIENYYNDWYYNTVGVIGTCFFSWMLAYLNFSWWSLGFVFFCTASVYRAEFRRFNRNVRDDMQRVTMEETLSDRTESSTWMNSFLSKFWTIYMPVLSQQVKDTVNPQLAGVAPGYGIDALSLNEFTLGTKAPTIDAIKSYTKRGKDTVEMEWTFSFTPNDESNMTPKEVKNKINPKIALGVTVGKGFVSKSLPVLVEDINIAGTMRILVKFGESFPNIKTVSISMLEPPSIDFALKPVGGDTLGLDIMSFLPGLKTFVKTMINSNVGPMLYAPNQLDIDVEELMAAQSQDAIGVIAISIDSAVDIKTSDFLSTSVDPYIKFTAEKGIISADHDVRTSIKSGTKNPRWNETKYLLVNTLEQKLTVTCYDFNDVRKDATVGSFEINLSDLYQNPAQENLSSDLKSSGKSKGLLNYSIHWFPVVRPDETKDTDVPNIDESSVTSEEDEEFDETESDVGIIKFTLHKVKYLNKAAAVTGILSPSAELFIDGKLVRSYRTLRRINEPSWEESLEVLVPSKSKSELSLKVYDEQIHGKRLLAEYSAPLEDVVELFEVGQTCVQATPQGEIYVSAQWKPVAMTGAFTVNNTIREPIAAVRIFLKDAILREDDLSGIGDLDPYITVTLNKKIVYRTNFFSDTKEPFYNIVLYVPITSENQNIALNMYDYQKIGKDRFFGGYHISASKLVFKDRVTGRYKAAFEGEKPMQCVFVNNKGRPTKSFVNATFSVVSTIPVYYPHEITYVKQLEEKIDKKKKEFEAEQAELKKEMEKNPDDYEVVEIEDKLTPDIKKLEKKEKMSFQELISYNSGVCSFQITDSRLSRPSAYLQLLYDDVAYPVTVSLKSINSSIPPEQGNFFVRDLNHSNVCFRVTKKPIIKDLDDVISEITLPTLDVLTRSNEEAITITSKDGSKFNVRFLFNPSGKKLPLTETILDTGIFDMMIMSADNIASHDRNGKSDPFLVIKVDGETLYKTQTVKKTLSPIWNETAKIPIPSRSRGRVSVEVYDWDRAGSNDLLGETVWDVSKIRPDEQNEITLALKPQGSVKLRYTFHPHYTRPKLDLAEGGLAGLSLKSVGTMTNFGVDALGDVAHVGAGVTGAGVGIVTGGLSKGGRLLKGFGNRKSKNNNDSSSAQEDKKSRSAGSSALGFDPTVPNTSYATVQPQSAPFMSARDASSIQGPPGKIHKRTISSGSNFSRSTAPGTYDGQVTIIGAENLGKSVQLRVSLAQGGRMKHLFRTHDRKADANGVCSFNETVDFRASSDANIVFGALSHHTFSKDTDLGVCQINLSDPQLNQDGQVALKLGNGHLIFKIMYPLNNDIPPIPQIPDSFKR